MTSRFPGSRNKKILLDWISCIQHLISTLMHSVVALFFNKWALFLTLISRQFLIVFLGNYTITKKEVSMSDDPYAPPEIV